MQKRRFYFVIGLLIFFLTVLFNITSSVFAADYRVSGAGINSHVTRFRVSMSLDVNSSSLETGRLKYHDTRHRISLISTSITGLTVEGDVVMITGIAIVRGKPGYTFTAIITDSNPDKMGIEVYKPDGSLYYRAVSKVINRGNFNIEVFPISIKTWSGGGVDNLASNPNNWSDNVVPQDGDNIVFNSISTDDCTWDINIKLSSFSMDSGYTGTIILNSGLTIIGNLTIAGGNLNLNGENLSVDGDIVIAANGSFYASSSTITLRGNWANSGDFNSGTSTVILGGKNQAIYGNTTFYNLTKVVASDDTLSFEADKTQTIANALTLTGASGGLLSLRSTSQGRQWQIEPQSTRDVSFADIKNSNNINITTIIAADSVDSGNNVNWNFNISECVCKKNGLILAQIMGD